MKLLLTLLDHVLAYHHSILLCHWLLRTTDWTFFTLEEFSKLYPAALPMEIRWPTIEGVDPMDFLENNSLRQPLLCSSS